MALITPIIGDLTTRQALSILCMPSSLMHAREYYKEQTVLAI
jgi:hypothetical protein